MIVEKI